MTCVVVVGFLGMLWTLIAKVRYFRYLTYSLKYLVLVLVL